MSALCLKPRWTGNRRGDQRNFPRHFFSVYWSRLRSTFGLSKYSSNLPSEAGERSRDFAVPIGQLSALIQEQPPELVDGGAFCMKSWCELILVVEDDPDVRDAVVEYLRLLNYEVTEAASPAEALDWASREGDGPALLLTDVTMPEMTGPEMAQQMRLQWPRLKIIFMTGYAQDFLLGGEEFQEVPVLRKPFRFPVLIQTIQEVLESTVDSSVEASRRRLANHSSMLQSGLLARESS